MRCRPERFASAAPELPAAFQHRQALDLRGVRKKIGGKRLPEHPRAARGHLPEVPGHSGRIAGQIENLPTRQCRQAAGTTGRQAGAGRIDHHRVKNSRDRPPQRFAHVQVFPFDSCRPVFRGVVPAGTHRHGVAFHGHQMAAGGGQEHRQSPHSGIELEDFAAFLTQLSGHYGENLPGEGGIGLEEAAPRDAEAEFAEAGHQDILAGQDHSLPGVAAPGSSGRCEPDSAGEPPFLPHPGLRPPAKEGSRAPGTPQHRYRKPGISGMDIHPVGPVIRRESRKLAQQETISGLNSLFREQTIGDLQNVVAGESPV